MLRVDQITPANESAPKRGRPSKQMVAVRKQAELARAAEFPEEMKHNLQEIFRETAAHLRSGMIKKMAPHTAGLLLGIVVDKLDKTSPPPTTVHNTQTIINNYSREAAMALLTGKKLKPVDDIDANARELGDKGTQLLRASSGLSAPSKHARTEDLATDDSISSVKPLITP